MNYICVECKSTFPLESHKWKCDCGGLLNLEFDKKPVDFSKTSISKNHSLWKYIDTLPLEEADVWQEVTMGEGDTPLIKLAENLYAKAEYYMPTLSFKDRGAAVLIAMAKKLGIDRVVADSSGNAGSAIAAFGARAGIQCDIFVADSTSDKKIKQIEAHGAVIHKIPGTREDVANAAIAMVEDTQVFYASHIFNPLFWEGTKTYVYEIYEQMDGKLPEAFIIPVGNGTLLIGAYIAFKELLDNGQIDKMPKILAVQATACAPIQKAFLEGENLVSPVENNGTLAEGIAIAAPARGSEILKAVRETNGDIITITDEETMQARKELALKGFYVEITSAVNYAAYSKYVAKYPELIDQKVVLPLCGAGIKSN
ncbi:pyridoxal-5'-phosphate-dependent protein subunit beta [Ureibacillus manganicus DSM 26584]|uniref:Pyridoxal-5'-phosphate-dependent protein subunit beta n=2 Tax=Ureibacillus TaxID=160795 RepID=A0A0A3IYL6_9BACL|nr:threonine synthase [Ureibacillus manganicus]KGR79912.1 pyridoxal-5'-phosphate-dependent protein subunit beta [Ureibacillus manganicus DSM 26584]